MDHPETLAELEQALEAAHDLESENEQPDSFFDNPTIKQSISRFVDEAGNEQLLAYFRFDSDKELVTENIHLVFWPAFPGKPEIHAQVLSDVESTCRVLDCQNFGAKIELSARIDPGRELGTIGLVVEIVATYSNENSA